MLLATSIELFLFLTDFTYHDKRYDFHNDYDCQRIHFEKSILRIVLKKSKDDELLAIKFDDVIISLASFSGEVDVSELTIDTLYRGRFEMDGVLFDSHADRAYFYLEFIEDVKMEFFAKYVSIEEY